MPIDASIYSQIQPPANPIDNYSKLAQLKYLQGHSNLQDLQAQQLQTSLQEEQAVKNTLANAPPGATLDSLLPDIMRASPKTGLAYQKSVLENRNITSQINERKIPALAGSFAMVLKAPSPTDDVITRAGEAYTAATGEPHDQITNHILSLPLDQRKQFVLSTAAANPAGQAALKLLYPETETTTSNILGTSKTATKTSGLAAPTARAQPAVPATSPTPAQPSGAATSVIDGVPVVVGGPAPTKVPPSQISEYNKLSAGEKAIIDNNAKMIANYDKAPYGSFAMGRPLPSMIMARVAEMMPEGTSYDETLYHAKQKTMNAFAAGPEGQYVRSLSVAHDHLNTWEQLQTALQNGNIQFINNTANKFRAAVGDSPPQTLMNIAQIIGPEIAKAVIPKSGVPERQEFVHSLGLQMSPGQQHDTAEGYRDLMAGQAAGLKRQFLAGGGTEEQFNKKLSPEVAKRISQFEQSGGKSSGTNAGAPTKITGDDDYAKLPSGSLFIGPDGKTRKKP